MLGRATTQADIQHHNRDTAPRLKKQHTERNLKTITQNMNHLKIRSRIRIMQQSCVSAEPEKLGFFTVTLVLGGNEGGVDEGVEEETSGGC